MEATFNGHSARPVRQLLTEDDDPQLLAEKLVLRGILAEPSKLRELDLPAEAFTDKRSRTIYSALAGLDEDLAPINSGTLYKLLAAQGASVDKVLSGPFSDLLANVRPVPDIDQQAAMLLAKTVQAVQEAPQSGVATQAGANIETCLVGRDSGVSEVQLGDARMLSIPLSSVVRTRVEWLWPSRIPLGKLTLFVGDPGDGKTLLACDIAARVTTGAKWPCSESDHAPVGRVLVYTCEDDIEDTIEPRIAAAGADMSKVCRGLKRTIDPATGNEVDGMLNLSTDIPLIEGILSRGDYRLVILDTITGFTGKIDNNSATDVRAALTPLVALAAKYRVAVIGNSHMTKDSTKAARYRTTGSIAYNAVARSVLAVGRHQDDQELRLLAGVKANLGPAPPTLGYRIATRDLDGTPIAHIVWEGKVIETTADEMLQGTRTPSQVDTAAGWLEGFLAGGARPKQEIVEAGEVAGFSGRTLDRARKRLGAMTYKTGMEGGWTWCLRADEESPPTHTW